MPNLYQAIRYHSIRRPKSIALVDDRRSIDYQQLAELIHGIAGALSSRGVHRGDRVAVLMENSIEYVALIHATALLGFVLVPLNIRYGTEDLRYALEDSRPGLLIHDAAYRQAVASVHDVLDRNGTSVMQVVDDWELAPIRLDRHADRFGIAQADDVCMIMYTSGTTSRPKGAMLTHGNFVWNSINYLIEMELTCRSKAILVAPLFHIAAFGVLNGPILYAGGTVYVKARFNAAQYIEAIESFQPTHVALLSVMWADLLAHLGSRCVSYPFVESIQSAAAPLSDAMQDRIQHLFPNAQWGWGFGMTESCVTTIRSRFTDEGRQHPGALGHPWRHVEYRLVDEDGRELEDYADIGELQVRGPTVFSGYWQQSDATREALTNDGWLRTGDLFRMDGDEYAYFHGRRKDMIKTGGENVAALEVETCLIQHPGVEKAAVFGLPHGRWGEVVVACVVLQQGATVTEQELRQFARERLTGFKTPKRIFFEAVLPLSSSGKVQKFSLRQKYESVEVAS